MPKCPVCGKTKSNKQEIIDHVEHDHIDDIPKDMSTAQFIYSQIHGRTYGLCRVCGAPTLWNEKTGKPRQLCEKRECKEKRRKIAQRNMLRVYGTDNLLTDPIHQEKMLANRKISGKYTWSDRKHVFTYTGSYEKFALEWLDTVMDYDPDDIVMPGPIVYYDFKGQKKAWITDMYIPDLNLVIEFKDGSFDRNTHEGFKENREREAAKDKYMMSQKQYNYTKITNKNMMSLVKVISIIRLNNIFEEDKSHKKQEEPVVVVHESVNVNDSEDALKKLSNSEIDLLCEEISNESIMTVANLSPITKSAYMSELKETSFGEPSGIKDSTMMFGDGTNSAIADSNSPFNFMIMEENDNNSFLNRLIKIKENKMNEEAEESDQMFSNHQFGTWNPFDSSDNFREINETGKSPHREDEEENPVVKTDVEYDPAESDINPVSSIATSNYSSNFELGE